MRYSVDVIIPMYKPGKQAFQLIERLEKQSYPIGKLIIINTEEKYFESNFYGTGFLEKYRNIEVHHISAKEFDHGRTRAKALGYSNADIFVCMTQDAIPKDEHLIAHLVEALTQQKDIAAAYAKQLPLEDCREIEKFTRSFNYLEEPRIKTKDDIETLGIKTFFCSNVCAAYHRNIYDMVGGFEKKTIFNEDMIFAGHAVKKGYAIAYAPQAEVFHSHNYTCMQQLRRNFDLGVSQAQHPEVFEGISSQKEGKNLVKLTIRHLCQIHQKKWIPYLVISSGCKYVGYLLGKHYESLPQWLIMKCTASKNYWNR